MYLFIGVSDGCTGFSTGLSDGRRNNDSIDPLVMEKLKKLVWPVLVFLF